MISRLLAVLGALAIVTSAGAYEWRSHNRMAYNARHFLLETWAIDPSLRSLIDDLEEHGFGEDLDTRAGDKFENAWTDEDHNEGKLKWSKGVCLYKEEDCSKVVDWVSGQRAATCTFDHFQPHLPLPLFRTDATTHARTYFDTAVRLYKAGICHPEKRDLYHRWAAQALGHAIHLVQDMGSPQHALPENHAEYPRGHGRSFHEFWALDVWGENDRPRYTKPDGTGTSDLGGFELDAMKASDPRKGKLEGIMEDLAAESRNFLGGSPYDPRSQRPSLLLNELMRVFSDSDFQPGPQDKKGKVSGWSMPSFSVKSFPIYGFRLPHNGRHIYGTSYRFAEPDYQEVGTELPLDGGQITVQSLELAERLWAQVDAKHPENPVEFDKKFHTLITHTTEAAAGAILTFWDEVKDYKGCRCGDEDPCGGLVHPTDTASARAGRAFATPSRGIPVQSTEAQFCPLPPPVRPHPPGRDNPDDTQGIVSNVSAVKTASVAQFDSVELGRHWRQIAAVGVEKGLPSLVDFGRTMRLLELAQDQTLTDTGKDEIARGMAEMERKYSVHRPRPEDDLPRAAHVGVLENGFAGEAASALDALGWTHLTVPITFDPLQLAEDQKVLLIPSGGLYGTSGSADLKERLRERSTAQQITSPKQPVAAALT